MPENRRSIVLLLMAFAAAVILRGVLSVDPVGSWLETAFQPVAQNSQQLYPDASQIVSQDLKNENTHLRQELNFVKNKGYQVIGADVVNKSIQSYRSEVRINRGRDDGIKLHQAVLAGGYLIGYIYKVDAKQSSAILIGDPDFRATVVIEGQKLDGIVMARAGGVVISELPKGGKDLIGKRVLTSGVGELFKPGFTLGIVGEPLDDSGIFKTYVLDYPLRISDLNQVLVVKS